jgi:hypothetical protein
MGAVLTVTDSHGGSMPGHFAGDAWGSVVRRTGIQRVLANVNGAFCSGYDDRRTGITPRAA